MEYRSIVLPVVLFPVVATQATIVQRKFEKLSGQNITGIIGAELKTRSRLQCAFRWVQYKLHSEDRSRTKGNSSVHSGRYNTNSTVKIGTELKVTSVVCSQVGTIQALQ